MRNSLYLAAAAATAPILALATPAHAGLQAFIDVSGTSISCAPPGSSTCVYNGPADSILTLSPSPIVVNGVVISGELVTATGVPGAGGADSLATASLAVINTTNTVKAVTVVVSDVDYAAPVSSVLLSGSGTFQGTANTILTFSWFADPLNAQGADPTNTPGTALHTFTTTATGAVQSFSTNFTAPFSALGPFSMTEEVTYDLQPFGELLSRGTTMVATNVPEPSSWVMMALGFAGLGFVGFRSSRTKIALID